MSYRRWRLLLPLGALLAASLACNAAGLAPPSATPPPTPTPPAPGLTDWEMLEPGLEIRTASIEAAPGSAVPVTLLRLDPAHYTLRVHYDSASPAPISTWQLRTGAQVVVNGGFFTPENEPLGLLVVDGQPVGQSYQGFGGMLAAIDGAMQVRALSQQPYLPGEAVEQAVQSRPVLIYPGGEPADFNFSTEVDRRTAVAVDTSGRLVIIIVDRVGVSLYTLRDWIAGQDVFDVHAALNLDGGGSTGLALAAGGESRLIDSWSTLPIVLAFYPAG